MCEKRVTPVRRLTAAAMGDEAIHTLFMTGLPNDVTGASLPTARAASLARFPTHAKRLLKGGTPPGSSVPAHAVRIVVAPCMPACGPVGAAVSRWADMDHLG
jgi:hypothetical protein